MNKLEQAAREVIRQHSMECLSDKTVDALRKALAEPKKPEECAKRCPPFQVCDYCQKAEQAEQEPVVKIHKYNEFQTLGSLNLSIGTKLYAAPLAQQDTHATHVVRTKDYNPDVIFNDDGTFSLTLPDDDELRIIPPQQEPTAEVSEEGYAWGKDGILPAGTKLYTRPIRTKDLTDDEIDALVDSACDSQMPMDMFARAVIAADRAKNNFCKRTK